MSQGVIIGLIIILILLLILVGIGFYAYHTIKNKVRNFSNQVFGTPSLSQGIAQMENEYAVTPKSVSAATSLYLPRIEKDFPDFHYDEMKSRAENVLISFLRSIDAGNVSVLTEGTAELKDQLQLQIDMLRGRDEKAHFDNIKIHRTEIYQYRKAKSRSSVVFQSAVEYYYYRMRDGQVVEGSKNVKTQAKFDIECIYIQDRDMVADVRDAALGVNCPNCGAPISGLGAKICAYCDTPVVELNIKSWNFSSVKHS